MSKLDASPQSQALTGEDHDLKNCQRMSPENTQSGLSVYQLSVNSRCYIKEVKMALSSAIAWEVGQLEIITTAGDYQIFCQERLR